MRRVALAAVLALLPGLGFADDMRIAVPITQTVLPDGDIRYSVPVRIGGSVAIDALLDTGSTGLRVLTGALPAADYTDTGFSAQYAFGSGDRLSGTIATAEVTVGAASTDNPVPFEVVNAVGCMDFNLNCAAKLSLPEYGIGGDGIAGQGFEAILGISLMPADGAGYTENPLAHIGAKRWIIDLPEPGEAGPGALILNPDDADLQGYTMFPLQAEPVAGGGPNVTWQDRLPGCLNNLSTGQQICGPAILDTGSPLVMAFQAGATQSQLWSPGNNVSLSFATGGSAPLTVPFLADRYAGTGLGEGVPDGPRVLAAGEMSFFAFSVFFDANAGVIGLRPRADAPDMLNVPIPDADANSQIEVIQMNLPGGAPQAGAAPALPQVITPSP